MLLQGDGTAYCIVPPGKEYSAGRNPCCGGGHLEQINALETLWRMARACAIGAGRHIPASGSIVRSA